MSVLAMLLFISSKNQRTWNSEIKISCVSFFILEQSLLVDKEHVNHRKSKYTYITHTLVYIFRLSFFSQLPVVGVKESSPTLPQQKPSKKKWLIQ